MTEQMSSVPRDNAEAARRVLLDILDKMGFPAGVEVAETPDQIVLTMVSEQPMGLLIGKGGQTLNAIELLVRTIVQQQHHDMDKHIVIDAEGYRERQSQHLQEIARDAAQTVLESGEPFALEPMNARDRRTVHVALAEMEGIATVSVGEEPFRRIVICKPGQENQVLADSQE